MKRYLALTLSTLAVFLFVACGGAEPTTTAVPTSTPAPPTNTPRPPTPAATTAPSQPTPTVASAPTAAPTATAVPTQRPTATVAKPKRGGILRTEMTRSIDGRLDLQFARNSTNWVAVVPLLNWLVELDHQPGWPHQHLQAGPERQVAGRQAGHHERRHLHAAADGWQAGPRGAGV